MEPGSSQPGALQAVYRITVQGQMAPHWSQWFSGLAVTPALDGDGLPVTILAGPVADQPALRGILNKLWDLNLTLISVAREACDEPAGR